MAESSNASNPDSFQGAHLGPPLPTGDIGRVLDRRSGYYFSRVSFLRGARGQLG
jgi:hypothetical protein